MKKILLILFFPFWVSLANAQTTEIRLDEVRMEGSLYAHKWEDKTQIKVYNSQKQALLLIRKDSSYFLKPDVRDYYFIVNVLATGSQTRLTNKGYLPSSEVLMKELFQYRVIQDDKVSAVGLQALAQKYQNALPVQPAHPKLFRDVDAADRKLESIFGAKSSKRTE